MDKLNRKHLALDPRFQAAWGLMLFAAVFVATYLPAPLKTESLGVALLLSLPLAYGFAVFLPTETDQIQNKSPKNRTKILEVFFLLQWLLLSQTLFDRAPTNLFQALAGAAPVAVLLGVGISFRGEFENARLPKVDVRTVVGFFTTVMTALLFAKAVTFGEGFNAIISSAILCLPLAALCGYMYATGIRDWRALEHADADGRARDLSVDPPNPA
ncbi:MAG: hypothetical protein ACFB2Z_01760 [Maricaulaceae bacterium]